MQIEASSQGKTLVVRASSLDLVDMETAKAHVRRDRLTFQLADTDIMEATIVTNDRCVPSRRPLWRMNFFLSSYEGVNPFFNLSCTSRNEPSPGTPRIKEE